MTDAVHVGRALRRTLSRLEPIRDRLLAQAGLGVMTCHELGLRLDQVRELLLEHLRDGLVVSLARTA